MITVSTRYDHPSALASSCFFLPYPPPPSMTFVSPAVFFLGSLPPCRCSLETKNRRKKIAFTAQFGAPMDAKINTCMSRKRNSFWNTIPICSMYGIFTYIWVIFRVNVGKYSIHGAFGIYSSQAAMIKNPHRPQGGGTPFFLSQRSWPKKHLWKLRPGRTMMNNWQIYINIAIAIIFGHLERLSLSGTCHSNQGKER